MIDTKSESILTFTEATKHLPRRRRNKRPSLATFYRWANDGIGDVRLEWIRIGGTRCTSKEALQRFFEALTLQAQAKSQTDTAADREIDPAVAKAEKVLSTAGI